MSGAYKVVIEGYGPSPFSSMGCLFDDDREEEMVYNVDVLFASDNLDEAREYMNAHAVRCARLYIRHKGEVVEEYEPPKMEKPVWNALPEGVHELPDLNIRVTVKDGKTSFEPLEKP
jgi:hypothetical protein